MNRNKKLKLFELEILDEIDRICQKNNIKYYLAFGSALGAVRHKGFIPWDDDIDLHMMAGDLVKFKKICQKELGNRFYYQDKLNDKYYYNYWAKVGLENTTWMPKNRLVDCKYGICIDIFPIFPAKDNDKDKKKIEKYMKILNITSSKYYVIKKSDINKTKKIIHQLIPNFVNSLLYKCAYKKLNSSFKNYDLIVIYSISRNKIFYFDKNSIEGNRKVIFENREKFVPNDIDKYLTIFYGNYMTLPPKNKRYGHDIDNKSIIYDFENSYKKYMVGDKNDKS